MTRLWNLSQLALRLVTLGSLIILIATVGIRFLTEFVDPKDPVNIAGYLFFVVCWLCACLRLFGWLVGFRIDTDETSG